MTAVAAISDCFSTWLSTVVLPLPRKPVSKVTGIRDDGSVEVIGRQPLYKNPARLSSELRLPSREAGGSSPPSAPADVGGVEAGLGELTSIPFDFVGGVHQLDGPAPQLLDNFRLH